MQDFVKNLQDFHIIMYGFDSTIENFHYTSRNFDIVVQDNIRRYYDSTTQDFSNTWKYLIIFLIVDTIS